MLLLVFYCFIMFCYFLLNITSIHCFVLFPMGFRIPQRGSGSPRVCSRKRFEKVSSRKLEKVLGHYLVYGISLYLYYLLICFTTFYYICLLNFTNINLDVPFRIVSRGSPGAFPGWPGSPGVLYWKKNHVS